MLATLRRQRAQKLFVVGIKFDFDWLRHASQATDQIFHQDCKKLDLKAGNMLLNLITNIVDDFVDAAPQMV